MKNESSGNEMPVYAATYEGMKAAKNLLLLVRDMEKRKQLKLQDIEIAYTGVTFKFTPEQGVHALLGAGLVYVRHTGAFCLPGTPRFLVNGG